MNRLTCQPRPDKQTTILIGSGARHALSDEIDANRAVVALVDRGQVQRAAGIRTKSYNVAGVRRNFRFEQRDMKHSQILKLNTL